ncbi:DUF2891 domain-containing protein [Pontibacter sp. G13]|uniref:DUF2891 domain-containing protein n=1 Tax=Pontibacter sp. G13 TaxID=3074898 RepID=UPI00288B247D|nr:DUF2891 domain-containing protein [Pontibacter sp. G13]WNJ16020.1 DUF2891 domain-containing protein [Pontibacter sp. G13]
MSQTFSADFLQQQGTTGALTLTTPGAQHFARLASTCIQTEYPNKLSHVMNDSTEVLSPKALHPAFYGCFDWHSSVHGHWMLVHLLAHYPNMQDASTIRQKLDENLSAENIQQEVAYLHQSGRSSFERMYGWSWLMKLALELEQWDDPMAKKWSANLKPLVDVMIERYLNFLPKQTYAIRTGEHPNTAFGLSFAWDYAEQTGHTELQNVIRQRAKDYFLEDANCPASWEPGGADFLSPCLVEADLMSRVLAQDEFANWYSDFLPELPKELMVPATVTDRTDGKLVHLDGLNLSRVWCFKRILANLPAGHPANSALREAINRHLEAALPNVADGNYEGEHWLASFAVYALTQPNQR